ncbi:hypothetical protein KM043_003602 [Ampulex compressa]|nr:hypothetical protein KM043_003602 [Ampulex compressa]
MRTIVLRARRSSVFVGCPSTRLALPSTNSAIQDGWNPAKEHPVPGEVIPITGDFRRSESKITGGVEVTTVPFERIARWPAGGFLSWASPLPRTCALPGVQRNKGDWPETKQGRGRAGEGARRVI